MKHDAENPTISIVIATYNSMRTIKECLESIRTQQYPQKNIEILVSDGGSSDGTIEVIRQYGAQIYRVDPKKQNAEYNKSVGIAHAKNEIIAMIDHDNVLPHSKWLKKMVRPFVENPKVVGAETLRYSYDPKGSLLDRYFALFGSGDPLVWFLGKTDRLSYMFDRYSLSGEVIQEFPYYVVRFSEDNMPTIGANGFLVRRDLLMKYAMARPGEYLDMDVNIDLIRKGYNTFAFVDDGILHKTGYGSIGYYFRRRMLFMRQYHLAREKDRHRTPRRFHMVSSRNFLRLIFAIFLSVTVVIPLALSIRGWMKVRDNAWFLHPVMAVGFVFIYAWVIIEHRMHSYANYILGK